MKKIFLVAFCVCGVMPLFAADGVETDGKTVSVPQYRHLKVTAWELRDRTDGVSELVQKREWLLLPRIEDVEITGNVVDVQDVLTGSGTVYLRLAPLPGSRNWDGPDFRIKANLPEGLEVIDRPCRTVPIPRMTQPTGNAMRISS